MPTQAPDDAGVAEPRPGIRQWKNPHNACTVVEIHYTADPLRRPPEWAAGERKQYPARAWRREQEIDWTAPAGEPVVPEYEARTHMGVYPRDPRLRLLRFWDFGFVSPVVLFAQRRTEGQLQVLRELCPFNTPLDQLLPMVRALTVELLGDDSGVWDAGDPAAENQTDLGSSAETLLKAGIRLHTCRPGTEVSYAGLRRAFLESVYTPAAGRVPALVLDQRGCPRLGAALAGGFALSEHPPHRPVKKHPEKDLVDALRYGWDNLGAESQAWRSQLRRLATADAVW